MAEPPDGGEISQRVTGHTLPSGGNHVPIHRPDAGVSHSAIMLSSTARTNAGRPRSCARSWTAGESSVNARRVPELGERRPRLFTRIMRKFAAVAATLLIAACGAGSGTERELPAGPPTSAAPSDDVLYVSYSQGNMVAAFRLGVDGFLPATPFSTMRVDSPRTMIRSGDFLYVGTTDRVVSAKIAADGSLPPLPDAETGRVDNGDISELLAIGDVIYATYSEAERLVSYKLESGQVPTGFLTSSGESFSDYVTMDTVDGYIYVHSPSLATIDAYRIMPDGGLDDLPEPQLPEIDIFGCEVLRIYNGVIYAGESLRERINTYTINSVGLPEGLDDGADPISHTLREERYVDIAFDGGFLYAAAYNEGRVDTYVIDSVDGTLPEQGPIGITANDTASYPTSLLVLDGFLYVAQAGRDRIDGYTLDADGAPSAFPVTSADPIVPGFPNTIVHGVYPP